MTYSIPVKDATWKKVKDFELPEQVCGDDLVNQSLLHEYVVMYLANQRLGLAHTKTRGDVTRSGRKLYRQKWSGRARVGDAGSPLRRKWGVAFGPSNEVNYSKAMPQKMKKKALYGALTLKVQQGVVQWLKAYESKEIKTKYAVDVLRKLGIDEQKTLVVLANVDETLLKSLRNVPYVSAVQAHTLNAYDLLTHKQVIFLQDALDAFVS